jgi:hypothetical protein
MESSLIQALRESRSYIRTRWEILLRQEQIHTALASPDLLVRLFDETLDVVFGRLDSSNGSLAAPLMPSTEEIRRRCPCGRNPLLAYYSTGEQVLLETLAKLQMVMRRSPALASDDLRAAIRLLARQEIESFCAVCQCRPDRTQP